MTLLFQPLSRRAWRMTTMTTMTSYRQWNHPLRWTRSVDTSWSVMRSFCRARWKLCRRPTSAANAQSLYWARRSLRCRTSITT